MYCNTCGASEQLAKTYCRKCGEWIGSSPPEGRLNVMITFNALSAVFAAASSIALFATYLGSETAKWSIYMAASLCLIISVYQSLSFVFAVDMKRRIKQAREQKIVALKDPAVTRELPPGREDAFISVPSVTDHTTELLERKKS